MKTEVIEKVRAEIAEWEYLKRLPQEHLGFQLSLLNEVEEDYLHIFSYEEPRLHCKILVYYHDETKEYKLKASVGLTEFCNIEYISDNIAELEGKLQKNLITLMTDLTVCDLERLSSLVKDKKILEWDYIKELPREIEGFELFISPEKPIKIINGSYIIIDYSDFATESNFIILYNVLRDEFCCELKYHNIPEITYEFDTTELNELALKLSTKLGLTLKSMRDRLSKEK